METHLKSQRILQVTVDGGRGEPDRRKGPVVMVNVGPWSCGSTPGSIVGVGRVQGAVTVGNPVEVLLQYSAHFYFFSFRFSKILSFVFFLYLQRSSRLLTHSHEFYFIALHSLEKRN